MLGWKKLGWAAKQVLDSSLPHRQLFHTSTIPYQASNCSVFGVRKKKVFPNDVNLSFASRKSPPRALVDMSDEAKLQRPPADTHDEPKSQGAFRIRPDEAVSLKLKRPESLRRLPNSHSAEEDEDKNKKKKKKLKRGPPGPIEFEDLTSSRAAHSDLPFAFRYSYTEVPRVAPVGFQEKFSPFGPGRLDRVWDGHEALPATSLSVSTRPSKINSSSSIISENSVMNMKKSRYSFKGVKLVNPMSSSLHSRTRKMRSREEVLGEPLTANEIKELVGNASKHKTRRQINMGRDGLTHNMLIEIQEHWKRQPVVRIRCKGVCTVDMNNIVFQLEDKTGGKVIYRLGGTIYLFRGRNFRFKDRPFIPPMLWKPHAPLYPPLITDTPGDLKVHEARALRKRGLKIMPLTILSKNAYYGDLIQHVREAFGDEELVRIDCKGLNVSDYKKIGAKLRDLVPCYLLSFQKDQVILWRGRENMLDHINCSESANTEAADIHSVDHEKNIHVMNDACNKTLSGKTESELNGSDENDTVAKDIFESGHEDDSPDPRESTANLNAHTADEIDASSFSDFCWTSEEETEELDACSKSDFCRLSDEKAAWRA